MSRYELREWGERSSRNAPTLFAFPNSEEVIEHSLIQVGLYKQCTSSAFFQKNIPQLPNVVAVDGYAPILQNR